MFQFCLFYSFDACVCRFFFLLLHSISFAKCFEPNSKQQPQAIKMRSMVFMVSMQKCIYVAVFGHRSICGSIFGRLAHRAQYLSMLFTYEWIAHLYTIYCELASKLIVCDFDWDNLLFISISVAIFTHTPTHKKWKVITPFCRRSLPLVFRIFIVFSLICCWWYCFCSGDTSQHKHQHHSHAQYY